MEKARRIRYYEKLLDLYAAMGTESFIVSKILQITVTPSNVFCIKCAYVFIPRVNCKTKLEGDSFEIICLGCGGRFIFGRM
ncbi:hypothetical protein PAEPH01_1155 [Pancytospora epiphaga]|nr:hypothetical protein PAEPH01_1155 [Pancytospora epiphaga]